jgi:hypothetical protein
MEDETETETLIEKVPRTVSDLILHAMARIVVAHVEQLSPQNHDSGRAVAQLRLGRSHQTRVL